MCVTAASVSLQCRVVRWQFVLYSYILCVLHCTASSCYLVSCCFVSNCIDDCMVHMSMLCSEIMDGIQKLQVGQVGLRERQEVIMVGQESHHMQQRLQSLQQREMVCLLAVKLLARTASEWGTLSIQAEGIQELQDHQKEIQDGLEEVVLAQRSSDVQQRLTKINNRRPFWHRHAQCHCLHIYAS